MWPAIGASLTIVSVCCWKNVILPCIPNVLVNLCGNCCSCLGEKMDYKYNLQDNLGFLTGALDGLRAVRDDVVRRVKDGELKGGQEPLALVTDWLSKVQTIETNTIQLIDEASGQNTSSQDALGQGDATSGCFSECFSMDNISIVSIGEKVFKRIEEIRILSSRGIFDEVTRLAPTHVVIKKDVKLEQIFGLHTTLEKTWENLMRKTMLGIYGMGGVGKTTLLTLINNKFGDEAEFDIVIWVTVSDVRKIDDGNESIQVVIEQIQNTIGERLRICDEKWSTDLRAEKTEKIGQALAEKPRFVLLLDNLWEEVSLSDIGIPFGKGGKVVFTTRTKDVCKRMGEGVDEEDTEVKILGKDDAWNLFKIKAKCSNSNAEILAIGDEIAAECCGLPLALTVIGNTMASKKTLDEWKDAHETLKSYPKDLEGVEKIYQVLQLSYENLKDDTARLCFQYCALFPKAYNIRRDELVEYWIGEGILDGNDIRERARAKLLGNLTIDTLVRADLLLEEDESRQKVYMHDMIRDMALWIISPLERFVVRTDAGLRQLPDVVNWITVTKMSLMNNKIKIIHDDPDLCGEARLITLFLQNNKLEKIAGEFFRFLSTLVVLDLSGNLDITNLPKQISELVALRYLSLSRTMIKQLPSGLKKMTRLIHLDLESTVDLRSISLISGLPKLQVLKFYCSATALDISLLGSKKKKKEISLLEILERLEHLQLLTITVRDAIVLEAFVGSRLTGKTQGLYLEGLEVPVDSFAAIAKLGSLHNLGMSNCRIKDSPSTSSNQMIILSNTWFKNLTAVILTACPFLKDLTWLIYAAKLESLNVEFSPKMEILINREKVEGDIIEEPFQNLQSLRLHYLGELRSFDGSPLSFPKLKQSKVDIVNCLKLVEYHPSLSFMQT